MYLIAIVIVLALAGGAGYWYFRRRQQAQAAANILNDPNPIATWTYTPQEWQEAVADEFSWARPDGGAAQIQAHPRAGFPHIAPMGAVNCPRPSGLRRVKT